jgi:hypothetical protein
MLLIFGQPGDLEGSQTTCWWSSQRTVKQQTEAPWTVEIAKGRLGQCHREVSGAAASPVEQDVKFGVSCHEDDEDQVVEYPNKKASPGPFWHPMKYCVVANQKRRLGDGTHACTWACGFRKRRVNGCAARAMCTR